MKQNENEQVDNQIKCIKNESSKHVKGETLINTNMKA